VLVERSSYESHPLGRLEWIKVYGLLCGRLAEAEAYFDAQADLVEAISAEEGTGRTVAFFYLSPNGYVNVRSSGDYVPKMIELAGGRYVFSDLPDDGARSTLNMQMETFYAGARDADVLIYNATVDGGMETLEQLLSKGDWLADFRAVQEGKVWRTEQNMFQQTSGIPGMIEDLHAVLGGAAADGAALHYLRPLR
jgi:iron complex transport system substrate-binding protein